MATFSIDSIESLEYDFTEIPSNSGEGFCKGKGETPEPTDAILKAYQKLVRDTFGVDPDADTETVQKAIEAQTKNRTAEQNRTEAEAKSEKLKALTAQLCQNKPSKADLDELPPRYLRGYMKHIFREIADPKV